MSGRLPARIATAVVAAVAAAGPLTAPATALETERLYLSGRGPADAKRWGFRVSAGRRAGERSTIPVPSQWELHGFGTYRYGLDDEGPDEEGRYAVRFTLPPSWRGRAVALVFEGVMTDCAATLNGEPLDPVHRGGFTRFRYDVARQVRFDAENVLEVHVKERSDDRSVERAERTADYWLFGGIYRPVYLEAAPLPAIERIRIDARHDGRLEVAVAMSGQHAAAGGATLRPDSASGALLRGEVRERGSGRVLHRAVAPIVDGEARFSAQVADVRPWSAEDPSLYDLRLAIEGAAGHERNEVFGFRTFALVPGAGLSVNGRRVVLRGVNRHSFWPTSGRALDEATNRRDVELLKALNANAVRSSHYPPDVEFLRACDELGLYVVDELPGWHDAYDADVGGVLVRELIDRDHNHPSVVAWANGNEGGWNDALDRELARHDLQGRPVLHPGAVFGGVDARHYPSWDELRQRLDPRAWGVRLRRWLGPPPIVMPTEALHGLYDGGLGAGLEDFWSLLRGSPTAGGLFLWSFVDEGVARDDRGGAIDTFGNFGPDGLVGPFRQLEASFWAVRRTWSPIAVLESEAVLVQEGPMAGAAVRMTIENRYDLSDLEGAGLAWEWVEFPGAGGGSERTLGRDSRLLPAIAPGERLEITLPTAPELRHGAEGQAHRDGDRPASPDAALYALRLRAIDRAGLEVAAVVLPVRDASAAHRETAAAVRRQGPAVYSGSRSAAGVTMTESGDGSTATLSAGDVAVEIDLRSGRLAALRRGGARFAFGGGPRAVGEREPTLREHRPVRDGADEGLLLRYDGALEEARFTLEPPGWLRIDYTLRTLDPSPLAGIVFDLRDDRVRAMRWLGGGPYRVWGNRRQAGTLGLWRTEYNDTATGIEWRYPELPGFYAGVRWATLETEDGELTVALEDPALHLSVLRPRFAEGRARDGRDLARHTRVVVPDGTLGILHAIPGIGTKFHAAEELGPQGRERLPPGRYRGRIRLRLEPAARDPE